jgi:hypothetical protein
MRRSNLTPRGKTGVYVRMTIVNFGATSLPDRLIMTRAEGRSFVGRIIQVLNTRHRVIRFDAPRQAFTVRSIHTHTEDRITVDALEDALREGIAVLQKRG